jgi:hypothetical protein
VRELIQAGTARIEGHGDLYADDTSQAVCVVTDSGRFYRELTELLRAHAILRLVVAADAEGFSSDLIMSGRAARAHLRHHARPIHADRRRADVLLCAQPVRTERRRAHSCFGPFFDALAAGDIGLATEIADLAPSHWRPDQEPEEDFLWQRTLGLLLIGAHKPLIEAHLARFAERIVEGKDARLEVCRALYAADSLAFDKAFRGLLCQREIEILRERRRQAADTCHSLSTQVYVEGIAVLKMARAGGISIAREYPMCPALALAERRAAEPQDKSAQS